MQIVTFAQFNYIHSVISSTNFQLYIHSANIPRGRLLRTDRQFILTPPARRLSCKVALDKQTHSLLKQRRRATHLFLQSRWWQLACKTCSSRSGCRGGWERTQQSAQVTREVPLEGETVSGKGEMPTCGILGKAPSCGGEAEKTTVPTWRETQEEAEEGSRTNRGEEAEKKTHSLQVLAKYFTIKRVSLCLVCCRLHQYRKLHYCSTKTFVGRKKKTPTKSVNVGVLNYVAISGTRSAANGNTARSHRHYTVDNQFDNVEVNQHCFSRGGSSSWAARPGWVGNKRHCCLMPLLPLLLRPARL